MSYRTYQRSNLVKWILVFVLIAAIIATLAAVIVKVNRSETTITVKASAYKIGTLNSEGKFKKDTSSIVTKDFISVEGLKIEIVEDADVEYSVFFYSKNSNGEKVFISATEGLSANLSNTSIPDNAAFVKVVITPTADAEVGIFEVRGYAKQVTITHNK